MLADLVEVVENVKYLGWVVIELENLSWVVVELENLGCNVDKFD